MNQINSNNIHDDYYDRVDQNRAERVNVAYPPATQTLNINSSKRPTPVPRTMAFRTPKVIGRPPARVTKPASIAKMATASRIEVSFLRVEIESGVNENSIVGPIATIFGQEKGTRPSQFWDPDVWDVCAFIRHSPDARRDEGDG